MLYSNFDGGRGQSRGRRGESVKADTTKSNPENTTTTTGKALQTRKAEHLVEGEAIMPNQADKTILSSAGIVANSDTTR